MSSIKGDGGKDLNQNEIKSGCRCLQSNNKGWRFWWSYANCSSSGGKVWSKDVLMDYGSSVNIISKSLRKKLKLKRPQLAPFVVQMADQWKV